MLKKIFSFLKGTSSTVKSTIDKSADFLDETLDNEYIANTIDKAKDLTGDMAQKAGEVYEKTKQSAEEFIESDQLQEIKNKGKEIFDDVTEKGKEFVDKAKENDLVKDISGKTKEFADKVADKGKEFADKAMENETVKSTVTSIKETTDNVADKITNAVDDFTAEEE